MTAPKPTPLGIRSAQLHYRGPVGLVSSRYVVVATAACVDTVFPKAADAPGNAGPNARFERSRGKLNTAILIRPKALSVAVLL